MVVKMIWLFFIYAFIGWVMETVYATGKKKRFVNRGLLDGPDVRSMDLQECCSHGVYRS